MPDRDRVIYDIERCICHVPDACRDCSKFNTVGGNCTEDLLSDALALLREQEAVKPKEYISIVNRTEYLCGACDCGILYGDEHCRHCGRQVKWDT